MSPRRGSKLLHATRVRSRHSALDRAIATSRRLHAVFSALATVQHAAAQARSAAELYSDACNRLVKDNIYRTAWWARLAPDNTLQIAVLAGHTPAEPPCTIVPRDPHEPWLRALRDQLPAIVRDDDANAGPLLRDFGWRIAIMLPVTGDDHTRGILCIGSDVQDAIASDETDLLVELARSLSTHAERIAAENALASEREFTRAMFECASYGMYCADAEGVVLTCNDAYARIAGVPRDQVIGALYQRVTSEDFLIAEREIVARVLTSGLASEYDKDLVRIDGFRIPVRLSVAPVRSERGATIGTMAIVRDIVAERAAAAALGESEERYRAAFRNNPDAIFVIDAESRIVDANPAAERLAQLDRLALVASSLSQLAPPDTRKVHIETILALVGNGSVHRPHLRFQGSRGAIVDTEVYGTTVGRRLWQVLARDIRCRIDVESKLLALKEVLEARVGERTSELKRANEALATAGRMKEHFLASMTHELRTPLNSVLGLADALLEGVYGDLDDQQRQILETMRDSGHHLLDLINDILDMSKIEAGRLELDLRSISVTEVCQTCLRMVRMIAYGKRIGTWMRVDPKFTIVVADERRLKQILVNLISNAVKFTPPGGRAGIEAWTQGELVYFSVMDTGIGIATPDLRRIFEPFTQIDSSLSRQQEGTGLGLALVRKLAELHGGRIDVDSEPGQGSRFTVILPRHEPPERDTIPPSETG